MPQVILDKVSKSFAGVQVLREVSVDIAEGEFCVLVGPSGSGKSTLLRVIAGLEAPTAGRVHIGPRDVTDLPPKARDVAMVFQSYALYPQLSVRDNMGFGLRLAGQPKATIAAKVDAAAQSLGLTDLLDRFPRQLSGGQRQRVAMGRAMVRAPAVFLFDEPLSNLDASLRSSVRAEIRAMHARSKTTSVYVTHDQTEAMTLGDRIVVLRNGAVEQSGTPHALYQAPVNRFVASFIGTPAMNFLEGRMAPDAQGQLVFASGTGQVQLPVPGHLVQAGACTVGLRPEHCSLVAAGTQAPAAAFALECLVQHLEFTGADTFVTVQTPLGQVLVKCDDRAAWRVGDLATLLCNMDRLHIFDAAEQRLTLPGWGA